MRGKHLIIALIGPALLVWHLVHPSAGFPAHDGDYLAHLSFVRQLLAGQWWPPPYSGMIGSHALAALLVKLSFLPTRAMLLASDLCLCSLFVCIAFSARRLSGTQVLAVLLCTLGVVLPAIVLMQNRGYFAQTCSVGLYAAYLCVLLELADKPSWARTVLACALIGVGALFYPDGFMLLLAGVAFAWWLNGHRWQAAVCFVVALFPAGYLFYRQYLLIALDGARQYDWTPQLIVACCCCAVLFGARSLVRARLLLALLGWYAFWTLLLIAIDFSLDGAMQYYALKNVFVLSYLLPFLVIEALTNEVPVARAIVFAAAVVAFVLGLLPGVWPQTKSVYAGLIAARSGYGPDDERCSLVLAERCKNAVVIPASNAAYGKQGQLAAILGYNEDPSLRATVATLVEPQSGVELAALPATVHCAWVSEGVALAEQRGGFLLVDQKDCGAALRFGLYRRTP